MIATAAAVAISLGACGQSDEDEVAQVVEGYFDDLSARDYAAACAAVGDEFDQTLTAYAEENFPKLRRSGCESVLNRIGSQTDPQLVRAQRQLEVREVRVDGGSAEVDLAPGQRAELAKRPGEWKITRLDFAGAR